ALQNGTGRALEGADDATVPTRIRGHCRADNQLQERNMSRMRKGFTLIELLIVVVIIGILAAIAIPKFASTKEKAYLASEKSDLRNMATSEEAYFSGNQTYTTDQSAMNFTTSQGVTISGMVADAKGWNFFFNHTATTE